MNDLVLIEDGEAFTTTFIIACGTEVEHKSVIQLARTYLADFEEFGRVAFQMEPFETAGGIQRREVARLNEHQATLLLTYMRNNPIVRKFKKRLVKSFVEMSRRLREQTPHFNIPTTLSGALRLAAEQAEQIERQQALIEQQKPAVEFVGKYVEATGSKGFRDVCKLLHANESRFREFLIDRKIMYRLDGRLVPYSQHLDAGRFELKTGVTDNDHAYMQSRFTAKGIQWIAGLWIAEQVEAAA